MKYGNLCLLDKIKKLNSKHQNMLNKNKFLQYEHRSMVKNNDVMALEIINYKIEKHLTCKKEHLNSKFLNN